MVSGSGKGHNAECQHRNLKNGFGKFYILFSFIFIYFLDFHVVSFLPKLYTLNRSGMCDIQVRQSRLQRGVSKLRVLTCFNIPPGLWWFELALDAIQERKIWDSFLFYFDCVGIFLEWKQFKFHCFVAFHVEMCLLTWVTVLLVRALATGLICPFLLVGRSFFFLFPLWLVKTNIFCSLTLLNMKIPICRRWRLSGTS